MSRPPPSMTWNIILFAMVVGPLFGTTFVVVASALRIDSVAQVFFVALFGWIVGVIPAFIAGVLFANLRWWFGSGYLFAACCGVISTLPIFYLLFGHPDKISLSIYFAIIVGSLSAMGTRYAATLFLRALGSK
ncbi:hypothetical protein EXN32_22490 [Agrobacterium tumefaciens]|uniref:hypothetical protein n=1 Tax=Agrobacterium TaxID=357 RepID=UPI00115E7105|nr:MULTISPECIES: hypothetical protein [Agrobacterium]MDA5241032.1 hypothetical protein [Agrobacterium sp. MAFF310724]MDA5249737.1 hypothetical protein [Agrobacterium sp. MAFF210268]TRB12256.1 hypothetical protein EXN32_22490 [Agrobacterium tumefaciens]